MKTTIVILLYGYLEIAQWKNRATGHNEAQVVRSVNYKDVVWC